MTNEELCGTYQDSSDQNERTKFLEELYTQNIRLIEKIIRWYAEGDDLDDLRQESFFAVYEAAERWKPVGGASFASYLVMWIRSVVRRYLDNNSSTIRISAHMRENLSRYHREKVIFYKCRGRFPSDEELSYLLGVPLWHIEDLKMVAMRTETVPLSKPIGEDLTIEDTIEDPSDRFAEVESDILNQALHTALDQALDKLPPKESAVIRMRFYDGLTLKEAGEKAGVDPERIRALQQKGMRKLRQRAQRSALIDFIEDSTPYYNTIGLNYFQKTHTSPVEFAVEQRLKAEQKARVPKTADYFCFSE